jgi:2-desacetyl-2-hydroxyethyl bacteriochlorophyllide A dehydrogenase
MRYRAYGGPDQIESAEVTAPRPSLSQLLVRVSASSVNPVDWKLHNGQYRWIMPVRFPSIPGFDVAGEVVETGSQVTRFKAGDPIFAMSDLRPGGACAEYMVVGEGAAARMPASLPALEAAAVPLAGLTALQALRDLGRVAAGKRVLVIGASGGVGHFAVQIAVSYGAEVTAVCSTRNLDMAHRLGARRAIDYTRQSDWRGPQPYDIVLDLVVQDPVHRHLPLLARDGVHVSALPSFGRIAAAFTLPFCSKRRVRVASVSPRGQDLDQLRALCDAGKLRPVIDRVFRLDDLAAAHAYSQRGRTSGKIAVALR